MLAAFFLIACNVEARASLAWRYQAGIDVWTANLIRGNLDCSAHAVVTEMDDSGEVGKAWAEARSKFLENISNYGLSISACSEFFNFWQGEGVLETALKEEFLLTGGVRPEFNHFMSFDTVKTRTGLTLLATHPSVRWIGRYLQEMKARLLDALSVDGLSLSEPSGGSISAGWKISIPISNRPISFIATKRAPACITRQPNMDGVKTIFLSTRKLSPRRKKPI